jgi:hypothetical protein
MVLVSVRGQNGASGSDLGLTLPQQVLDYKMKSKASVRCAAGLLSFYSEKKK